jgi:hypothetical protein
MWDGNYFSFVPCATSRGKNFSYIPMCATTRVIKRTKNFADIHLNATRRGKNNLSDVPPSPENFQKILRTGKIICLQSLPATSRRKK